MKYCSECGSELIIKECFNCNISEGFVPYCPNCDSFKFPPFNTAVSMVIFNKDYSKILLIKQYGRDNNILVAGYVSKGENLETTLKRELKEEVDLDVLSFKYNESQYFEKSNTLICNFIVQSASEDFHLTSEVDSASWFSIEAAKNEILKNSLAEYFLNLALKKICPNKISR